MILFILKTFGFCFWLGARKLSQRRWDAKRFSPWNEGLHFCTKLGGGTLGRGFITNFVFLFGFVIFMLLLSFDVCVQLDLFFPLFGVVKFCGTFVSSNLNIQLLHWSNCLYCFGLDCL